ncbi:CD1247 N-terminal domain-containing protein [Schnuerera sp.]|uniref:CD1247 N-terminal domain-containing protein n=1 Tax=Schnuerera sp. TaxID=2794844 RepID=UPI002B5B3887|nr:CD1247 N-terminal domain-containing protein [Schnuerera sp.]HSH35744.1 hypothetical protein [Schnuerera sp.]
MEYLYQKVSYLKGLAEGLEIEEESKEGKLLLHIIDALEDFADVIDEVIEDHNDLEQYVEYIDEDLTDIEDEIYEFDDEGYYPYEELDDDYLDEEFDYEDFDPEDELEDELEQ